VINLSEAGLQILHEEPLKIGSSGKLRLLGEIDGERIEIRIRILWSRLLQEGELRGKMFRSGAHIEGDVEEFAGRLGRLIRQHGQLDRTSMQRKLEIRRAREAARLVNAERANDEQKAIDEAMAYLRSNPEEAMKWYNRARYDVRLEADRLLNAANRQDILAVWEYLERRIPLDRIARSFEPR
jgi:hypothetical protein